MYQSIVFHVGHFSIQLNDTRLQECGEQGLILFYHVNTKKIIIHLVDTVDFIV